MSRPGRALRLLPAIGLAVAVGCDARPLPLADVVTGAAGGAAGAGGHAGGGGFSLFSVTAGSGPMFIVAGPDGNVWFTEEFGNAIGRITPDGALTEFPLPRASSLPWMIT